MTQDVETNGLRNRAAGDALLLAHTLWQRSAAQDEVEVAPESLGVLPEAFDAIRDFHRRIVSRPKDEPLILCRGVSCRMHGADDFHVALRAKLDAAGVLAPTVDVHCLSQCEHGPNLKVGDAVLCTGKGCVVTDVRPWRPLTAGPKLVETPVPPLPR